MCIPCVNVKVMKRWKAVIVDDEMKRTMSRDSENARSHPIKPVTTSACVFVKSPTPLTTCSSALYCTGALRDCLHHRAVPCGLLRNRIPIPTLICCFEVVVPNSY